MRHVFLPAVLAITLTSGLAFAQAPAPGTTDTTPQVRRHAHNPHREAMKMSQRLNLSADQTAKLEPILASRDEKAATLRGNTALSLQDTKMQMRAIHRETRQQLNAVLTPEQMQQLKTMRRGHGAPQQGSTPAITPST
jgi:protein CpxP